MQPDLTVSDSPGELQYVDPRAGTITLEEYAERWLEMQTFDASSRETVTSRLVNHVIPQLGDTQLRDLHPSMIQAWLRGRQQEIGPRYVGQVLTSLSAILRAAVEDGRIATNPV